MAYELWSQDVFSKGELSPYMYARATVSEYGNGLKTAQNVLTYPTGAAGKRFGTLFQNILNFTNTKGLFFETFQYLNECIYQLVFYKNNIDIYLEGIFVANVTTTLEDYQVYNISSTVLNNRFRVAFPGVSNKPFDLVRGADSGQTVTGFTSSTLVMAAASFTAGRVLPFQFTSGTIPTSNPTMIAGVTYFINPVNATTVKVYSNATDAKFDTLGTAFTFSDAGTVAVLTPLNTWTFPNTKFKNLPVYDFNGPVTSYDAITFTPSAATGSSVTITLSGAYAPLTSAYVGGAFIGGGGTSRIIAVADTSHFTVSVQDPFDIGFAAGYIGSLCLLAEPAWSDTRGWPQVCSSYQNRALFANTASLPNGFFASVINDYGDFGDLTNDDDDAISWYPTSNNINFIRFIVPYRSITVHTNTGIYSSPLSDVSAITPSNFTLQLQDSTPADVLQPQAIDNQVLVLSGNDAHQMLWDGINNAYTSDIVSVISEQTIRNPVDEVAYADLHRAGSRYVFIINDNGSMAIFQTLISQNVSGFTPQVMEQSNGSASFIQAASSTDGRAWFVVQRDIATASAPVNITNNTDVTLTAIGSNFSTTEPTAVIFSGTTLPQTMPGYDALQPNTYYWVHGVTTDTFAVYTSRADVIAQTNVIKFTNFGTSAVVTGWPIATNPVFTLEELTQDTYIDCAVYYNGAPASTITTGTLFNTQDVVMVGDGYGFKAEGINNQVTFEAHGVAQQVSEAYIGFPINTIMEPMPLTLANGPSAKNTTLTKPKHIRSVRFMFNNTIGGTINGIDIAIKPFNKSGIGEPPVPARGIMEIMPLGGWDDFNNPTYTIEHSDPFNIELLGVFYSVEI